MTWAGNSIKNTAILTSPSGYKIPTKGEVPINSGDINKTLTTVEGTDNELIQLLNWNLAITMPKSQVLPARTVFTDTLNGKDGGDIQNHYFTKNQITSLYNNLTKIFGAENFTLEAATIGDWNSNYIDQSLTLVGNKYYKIRITLLKDFTSSVNLNLAYQSTIDATSAKKFTNTVVSGSHTSSQSYDYKSLSGKLTKMDGNTISWNGSANDFNASTTSHTIAESAVDNGTAYIKWAVKVELSNTDTTLTVTDTPPEGLELVSVEYGNIDYRVTAALANGAISKNNTWDMSNDLTISGKVNSNGQIVTTAIALNGQNLSSVIQGKTYFYFVYTFRYKGEVPVSQNATYPLTNNASVTINGEESGSDGHTQNITVEPSKKISKNGGWDSDKKTVDYSLAINPKAQDLVINSDSLTIIDVFKYTGDVNTGIAYQLLADSITLVDSNNQVVDKSQYSWTTYTIRTKSDGTGENQIVLKVIVPDGQAYTLKYSYQFSANKVADPRQNIAINVSNSARIYELADSNAGNSSDSTATTTRIQTASVSFETAYNITKVMTGNYGYTLPGAVFTVYEYGTNKKMASYTTGAKGTLTIFRDGRNASENIAELDYDTVYYIMETTAPSGYRLSESPNKYYFQYSDTGITKNPPPFEEEVIDLSQRSANEYVENDPLPSSTTITINKKWLDANGQQTTRSSGSIDVNLMQVKVDDAGKILSESRYGRYQMTPSGSDIWTLSLDNVPTQTKDSTGAITYYRYYVTEDPVEGYDVSYDVTKDNAVASGDITLANQAQQAYVLPETGGIGPEKVAIFGLVASMVTMIGLLVHLYRKYQGGAP